jgi:fructose-1,6-bisphosphatase-3
VVLRLFEARRSADEIQELLKLVFYPQETLVHFDWSPGDVRLRRTLSDLFDVMVELAKHKTFARVRATFPEDDRPLLEELLFERVSGRAEGSLDAALATLADRARFVRFVRVLVRVVRNLAVDEIVVAGDCYDRGPRADRVVDYLMRQPRVRFAWGNHDVAWIGAALGHDALIAHVLRVSLRYRRLSQLEEGYGITLQPLEKLARDVYGDDPAERFGTKGKGLRDDAQMARMQKAAAVMQHKLEGRLIERNDSFELGHRRLLHRIDRDRGTVLIDGVERKLSDARFPTIDPSDPYRLSDEEAACLDRTRTSFLSSDRLWQHIRFLADRGAMALTYDDHVIFHGCVPVDGSGALETLVVDGEPRGGRALFDAFERGVHRAVETPSGRDLDLLWYLWCGPKSPLFGKDRITTFERDLVADKETHHEKKNAYFELIHDPPFCARMLSELGADPDRGLLVNGHVPVKIE